jgi:predicted DsbA family dithiol-disulfide isomerase
VAARGRGRAARPVPDLAGRRRAAELQPPAPARREGGGRARRGAGAAHARAPVPRYFAESRDISDPAVLRALWDELGLDAAGFVRADDPETRRRVLADHEEAQALGAHGVPAVRLADQELVLVGAQPEAVYRRWFRRALEVPGAS